MHRFLLSLALVGVTQPALAQRSDDNATTQAADAFGTSVGGETIGIYNPHFVRGFSAVDAGNVRLNGLYFDQQAELNERLIDNSTVRVGLSAQNYPFPAPTGIAEFDIRRPEKQRLISSQLRYGPYDTLSADVDAQLSLSDALGFGAGIALGREGSHWGGDAKAVSGALIARWRPAAGVEIMPFWSGDWVEGEEPQPLFFTGGEYLPPRIPRNRRLGPAWAANDFRRANYGIVGSAVFGDWTLRTGLFRSVFDREREITQLFLNVTEDGSAQQAVIADPPGRAASVSGEVRVSRFFEDGPREHILHVAVRGRDRRRTYGGGDLELLGVAPIDEAVEYPEPAFVYGEQTRDRVRQWTAGVAYQGIWRDVGELSFGIQKSDYQKTGEAPDGPMPRSTASPWLFNGTLAVYLGPRVAVYGGYTRGLEESPVAPDIAVNKGEAPPAIRTRQADAGIRWAIQPNLKLVLGVFDVRKPYFNVNADLLFTRLGEVRHRGLEFSLAGQPLPRLTTVLGTVILDAETSGAAVDQGLIGKRPIGSLERMSTAVVEYKLPWIEGASVDAVFEAAGDRPGNARNSVTIPARTALAVGGRYRFRLAGAPATFRAQVGNVQNTFGWAGGGSGFYAFNYPRRVTVSLTADF